MLLTDVEGSTVLWEEHPVEMRHAMQRHHEIGHDAISRHFGYLPPDQGEGDSLFAVFSDAREGVACALAFQRALAAEDWSGGLTIKVRAALHTGSLDLRDGRNYSGIALNRCARLRAIAHGGQTVLSSATRAVVGDDLPEHATLDDLGTHGLKDLSIPEHVFELRHPDLADDFPPLVSLDVKRNNLPVQLTSFVGRERELIEVGSLLRSTRLLTLTGAGGSGKTRLALQVAAGRLDGFPDGVWFVELDRITDPSLVASVVANAMSVREEPGRTIVDSLTRRLSHLICLIVFDNCEHLVNECARLAKTLLEASPGVTLLCTSREALSTPGEVVWSIPQLSEAVELFVDRATSANPRFALTDRTAPSVEAICSRLDGNPLAIELAAARVQTMTVHDVQRGLDDGFRLLTSGSRTALPRQRTLQATVEWSHDLLSPAEQIVFRRLAVFAGGFNLHAVGQVCTDAVIDEPEAIDVVMSLVAKSLVILHEDEDVGRYRLLETIREYALEKLREAAEEAATREKHLDWCVDLAEQAEPEIHETADAAALDRLQADLDNCRAALGWSLGRQDAGSALRLASALLDLWTIRADWTEGRDWVERALALPGEVDPGLRAKGLRAAGSLADVLSDYTAAVGYFEESLRISRTLGDERQIAAALMGLVFEAERIGRSKDARPLLEEAIAIFRRLGDGPSIAESLGARAWLEESYPRARSLWVEHLAARRKLGNREAIAWAVMQVGWAAEREGDYAAAQAAYSESLAIGRELGYRRIVARSLTRLADTARLEDRREEARALYEESLPIWRGIGHRSGLIDSLRGLGDVALREGDRERAESLLTESLAIAREVGARRREARAQQSLAALARAAGESSEAVARYREVLAIWVEMDHVLGIAICFRGLGETAIREGALVRGTRLLGGAENLMERLGAALPPCEREDVRAAMDTARADLGPARLAAELDHGRALTLDEAVRLGMSDDP